MLPHLKHLLYPKMIVSFTEWCLGVEQRSQCPLTWSHRQPLLCQGGIGGQDSAFNQLPVLLPLLLFSSDEVKVTYFVYLILLSHERNLLSALDLSQGVWQGSLSVPSLYCTLLRVNAIIKSLNFYINIGFLEIQVSLSQSATFYLPVFPIFGRTLYIFTVTVTDEYWCSFISPLTLPGL